MSFVYGFPQGQSTYSRQIKQVEDDIQQLLKKINELTGNCAFLMHSEVAIVKETCWKLNMFVYFSGIKESDTGLAPPALWDLAADKQTLQSEQPLQVARYDWPEYRGTFMLRPPSKHQGPSLPQKQLIKLATSESPC